MYGGGDVRARGSRDLDRDRERDCEGEGACERACDGEGESEGWRLLRGRLGLPSASASGVPTRFAALPLISGADASGRRRGVGGRPPATGREEMVGFAGGGGRIWEIGRAHV